VPEYSYQVCDVLTDEHITWLEGLQDVSLERRISGPGAFSATIPITGRAQAAQLRRILPEDPDDITAGVGRTLLHVWRGPELWGSYILMSAVAAGDERGRAAVSLQGATIESWLYRAMASWAGTWANQDQLDIARSIILLHQTNFTAHPNSNLGIEQGGQVSSGILQSRSWGGQDMITVGEMLDQLCQVPDGPEWYIRTYPDGAERRREFYVAQRLGDPSRVHVYAQPGDLLTWRETTDATDAHPAYRSRGEQVSEATGRRIPRGAQSDEHEDTGWPWTVGSEDHPAEGSVPQVEAYAEWLAEHRSPPIRTLEATVRLREDTSLTPDRLGDPVRLMADSPWWPGGLDETRRLIGMTVRPPGRGRGVETADLVLEQPRGAEEAAAGIGPPRRQPDVWQRTRRVSGTLRTTLSIAAPIS
jgi:hypothetical protein